MEVLRESELRQLPYQDLQKYAKNHGIKANMKADKLISALLSESFNCSKGETSINQQEASFDGNSSALQQINGIPVVSPNPDTPRRETFTVESPFLPSQSFVENKGVLSEKENFLPQMKKENPYFPPILDDKNITGQETATPSKAKNESIRKSSVRKTMYSTRKSIVKSKSRVSKSKVVFITPVKELRSSGPSSGSKFTSVKDRPKTPAAVTGRRSATKRNSVQTESLSVSRKHAPTPKTTKYSDNCKDRTPRVTPFKLDPSDRHKLEFVEEKSDPDQISGKREQQTQTMTPVPTPKQSTKSDRSRIATPNFKKIHEKAFEKMESIDEYQIRKRAVAAAATSSKKPRNVSRNSAIKTAIPTSSVTRAKRNHPIAPVTKKTTTPAKSKRIPIGKIPKAFSGIPFIPSVTSASKVKTNFFEMARRGNSVKTASGAMSEMKRKDRKCTRSLFTPGSKGSVVKFSGYSSTKHKCSVTKTSNENKELRKSKFDLAASLAKKLPYKPYTGPVKPLSESGMNLSRKPDIVKHLPKKNQVVEITRNGHRDRMQGVRKTRRFEQHMTRRGLAE